MNLENSTKTFTQTQEIIVDRFIKLSTLYSSQYHEIIYVYDKFLDKNSVLKYLKPDFVTLNNKKLLKEEFLKIISLRSNNVVRAYELYDNENQYFYSMEYIDSEFNKENFSIYVDSILDTFKYIHDNKIIHNDIKNNNFIFNDKLFILIDFSFAKRINSINEVIEENRKLVRYLIYWINHLFNIDFLNKPKKAKRYISERAINNIISIYNNDNSFIY